MKYQQWHFVDKSTWEPGPWHDEPDKEQYTDPGTGLPCLILRNSLGSLCGYVGVPEGHPWHRVDHGDLELFGGGPDVHGGLTFSAGCQEEGKEHAVCHVTEPDEPDNVWWLGFDTAHAFDLQPGMRARELSMGSPPIGNDYEVYRDIDYIKAECARLAAQVVIVTS